MFPVMSSFAEEDEEYVKSVVPQFARFGKVLQVQQCSAAKVEVEPGQVEAFYKKSCVAVLQQISPRNSEDKWKVTLESFRNEHRFLGDNQQLIELHGKGVGIPKVLALHQSNTSSDFSTVFRTVLEYLTPSQFREERRYGLEDAKRILEWLARFHEHFTERSTDKGYLEQGGWWRKPLRPTVKFDHLLLTVRHLCQQFPNSLSHNVARAGDEVWLDLTKWKQLDRFRLALGPNRTLMHGDCKSSNFFLSRNGEGVTGIDFQWVGGSPTGAGDVVYLLFGSVELVWEREAELKQWYLSRRQGVCPEAFDLEFDLELLDYFTTVCPYLLADLTPKRMGKNLAKYGYLTYEDDEPSLRYFFERVIKAYGRIKSEFEKEEAKRQRMG